VSDSHFRDVYASVAQLVEQLLATQKALQYPVGMGAKKPALEAECRRLREKGHSYQQIHEQTGAAMGSLAKWLKGSSPRPHHAPTGGAKKDRGDESPLHRMVSGTLLSRQTKAKIAEAAVLLRLVVNGFVPFGSVFDGDKTDWLVEVPTTGKTLKIQVKWAGSSRKYGMPCISLTCTTGHNQQTRYKPSDFDFIVGYDFFTDISYVWSYAEVQNHKRTISIRPDAKERWDKLRA
jgi:hypothetical protein